MFNVNGGNRITHAKALRVLQRKLERIKRKKKLPFMENKQIFSGKQK